MFLTATVCVCAVPSRGCNDNQKFTSTARIKISTYIVEPHNVMAHRNACVPPFQRVTRPGISQVIHIPKGNLVPAYHEQMSSYAGARI